jgi:cytochrome c
MTFAARLALAVAALSIPALASPARADSVALEKALVAAGKIMFDQRCHTCHANDASMESYGPPLTGVVGRKAGTVAGYEYSEAMKTSGLVWTEAAIRAWMTDNKGFMPGTRMRHVGVTNPEEQDFILAYLRSISK